MVRARGRLALLVLLSLAPATAAAETLRVGTSGDYAPFSRVVGGDDPDGDDADPRYEGFDIEVARAYAEERGVDLVFVRFAWPELLADLAKGRFDVAMSGVTLRPERSLAGRFSVPTTESGALALVVDPHAHPNLEALNTPGVRICLLYTSPSPRDA